MEYFLEDVYVEGCQIDFHLVNDSKFISCFNLKKKAIDIWQSKRKRQYEDAREIHDLSLFQVFIRQMIERNGEQEIGCQAVRQSQILDLEEVQETQESDKHDDIENIGAIIIEQIKQPEVYNVKPPPSGSDHINKK